MSANRFISLEERTRRVQDQLKREGKPCDWHSARREMARRSAKVRRWRKARRTGAEAPIEAIVGYRGPKLIMVPADKIMTDQDNSNITRQADYLRHRRASLGKPE